MLSRPHELFGAAFNMQYALGAFNFSNLEFAQAILGAAQTQRAPVIVQTSEGAIEYAGLAVIKNLIETLAAPLAIPIVLHLDHGKSATIAKQCIEAGYASVMIDCSTKPLNENIRITREVAQYAHDRGVWVEAELGAIMGSEGAFALSGQRTPDSYLTKPQEAARFVAETGIDALAVSVGTIHGAFTGQEYVRFELLEEIERVLPQFPLVVHGASGIAPDHLARVATSNVCKINVDTELRIAFDQALRAYCAETHEKIDPRDVLGAGREAVQCVVEEKIKLFGSANKAWV